MERIRLAPYAESVDGLVLPAPLGGHPALDFCNTFAGWDGVDTGDFLQTYDHLVVFAFAAGLIPEETAQRLRRRARREPAGAQAVLVRTRELRRSLYRVILEPGLGRDWDRVAADAGAARAAAMLSLEGRQGVWRYRSKAGLATPRLAIAAAGAALLTSGEVGAVHACPGRGCGWLFLDPGGRRRWCTMAVCGNRAKARRYSERHRPGMAHPTSVEVPDRR